MVHTPTTQWQLTVSFKFQVHTIPLKKRITLLGRSKDADICLMSTKISRRHAQFEVCEDGTLVIEDLGSQNGTLVNRDKISGRRTLKLGDKVRVSQWKFVVGQREISKATEAEDSTSLVLDGAQESGAISSSSSVSSAPIEQISGSDSFSSLVDLSADSAIHLQINEPQPPKEENIASALDSLPDSLTDLKEESNTTSVKIKDGSASEDLAVLENSTFGSSQETAGISDISVTEEAMAIPETQEQEQATIQDEPVPISAPIIERPAEPLAPIAPSPPPIAVSPKLPPAQEIVFAEPPVTDETSKKLVPSAASLNAARKIMEMAKRNKIAQAEEAASIVTSASNITNDVEVLPLEKTETPALTNHSPAQPPLVISPPPLQMEELQNDVAEEVPKHNAVVIAPAPATLVAAKKLMEAAQRNKVISVVAAPTESSPEPIVEKTTAPHHTIARDISTANDSNKPEISCASLSKVQTFSQQLCQLEGTDERTKQLLTFATSELFPANVAAIVRMESENPTLIGSEISSLPGAKLYLDANLISSASKQQSAMVAWDTCLDNGAPAVSVCCPLSPTEFLYTATVLSNTNNAWIALVSQAALTEKLIRQIRG